MKWLSVRASAPAALRASIPLIDSTRHRLSVALRSELLRHQDRHAARRDEEQDHLDDPEPHGDQAEQGRDDQQQQSVEDDERSVEHRRQRLVGQNLPDLGVAAQALKQVARRVLLEVAVGQRQQVLEEARHELGVEPGLEVDEHQPAQEGQRKLRQQDDEDPYTEDRHDLGDLEREHRVDEGLREQRHAQTEELENQRSAEDLRYEDLAVGRRERPPHEQPPGGFVLVVGPRAVGEVLAGGGGEREPGELVRQLVASDVSTPRSRVDDRRLVAPEALEDDEVREAPMQNGGARDVLELVELEREWVDAQAV